MASRPATPPCSRRRPPLARPPRRPRPCRSPRPRRPGPHRAQVRHPFVVLVVLYWSVNAPRLGGIALGFFSGFALDVFQGPVLGQHALALSLVAYIAVREAQRIRTKPALQQALVVFGALAVYEFAVFAIDGW